MSEAWTQHRESAASLRLLVADVDRRRDGRLRLVTSEASGYGFASEEDALRAMFGFWQALVLARLDSAIELSETSGADPRQAALDAFAGAAAKHPGLAMVLASHRGHACLRSAWARHEQYVAQAAGGDVASELPALMSTAGARTPEAARTRTARCPCRRSSWRLLRAVGA